MTTVTRQPVHQQRADTLADLALLAGHHGLPLPKQVTFLEETHRDYRDLDLQLDDDRQGSVRGWAQVLGLGGLVAKDRPASRSTLAYTSVIAEARDNGTPLWLRFDHIKVWSACRAECPSEYSREIDNGDPAASVPAGVLGVAVGDSGPDRHTDTPTQPRGRLT